MIDLSLCTVISEYRARDLKAAAELVPAITEEVANIIKLHV
jgi:hypothetical protein